MRVGIKAKQIAGVTAIVGLAVVMLSAVHVARLARVVLRESQARGELLANTIFHRAREVVIANNGDPYAALRSDPGLRAILESSIYGESVTGAAILDNQGVVRASSDPAEEGQPLSPRADLATSVRSIRCAASTRRKAVRWRCGSRWSSATNRSARFASACRRC